MAILQGLIGLITRSAGKLFNTAFGWATILLFGKVREDRQIYLSVISFGALAWMIFVVGIAFPSAGTFLLSFVPLPDSVDDNLVRLIMLAAAALLPAGVGILSISMLEPGKRPQDFAAKMKIVLKGYPYTLGLALTLAMMLILAPIMKIRDLSRRWQSAHIPILVESKDYENVLEDIHTILEAGGYEVHPQQASAALRWPTKVLTLFAGGNVDHLVADRLTTLKSLGLEVMLHPSDLILSGPKKTVNRVHALLTEHLTFTKAYLTWDKDANQIEDKLRNTWLGLDKAVDNQVYERAQSRLHSIELEMKTKDFPYEEWEILFRQKILIERKLYRVRAGIRDRFEEKLRAQHSNGASKGQAWVNALSWAFTIGLFIWRKTKGKSILTSPLGTLAVNVLSKI